MCNGMCHVCHPLKFELNASYLMAEFSRRLLSNKTTLNISNCKDHCNKRNIGDIGDVVTN